LIFWCDPRLKNARILVDMLHKFGFGQSGFEELDFLKPEQLIQLGRVPTRIDLLTSISGVRAKRHSPAKFRRNSMGFPRFVLGKDALMRNKRAVGRAQDLADHDTLTG
jgi:hypothetical protein